MQAKVTGLCKVRWRGFMYIVKHPFKKDKILFSPTILLVKSFQMICSNLGLNFRWTLPLILHQKLCCWPHTAPVLPRHFIGTARYVNSKFKFFIYICYIYYIHYNDMLTYKSSVAKFCLWTTYICKLQISHKGPIRL